MEVWRLSPQGHDPLPLLARVLLGWLAGPAYKEHVLGDLQEELSERQEGGEGRLWIWKQVVIAIPGLLALRTQDWNFRAIGLTVILTFAAYALLIILSVTVTRPIMMNMRDSFSGGPSWDYLYFYMLVRLPGVFLVGAAMAYLTFQPATGFLGNFVRRMLPLLLILIVPQVWYLLAEGQEEFAAGRIIRAFADGMVLYGAAYFGQWLKLRQLGK